MCYKPLHILNKKLDFDSRFDKVYIDVPCGKCCECQNAKVTSWSLRNYYEFIYTKSLNGVVCNITLTYNDEHLPKVYDIATFCKSDVQKFLKLLRKWLVKDGLMPDSSLRYFITSEYGHLHQRPHYHCLFYLLAPINPMVFYRYCQKYWHRGFVGYGQLGVEVLDYHALQYACKYITKDSSYQTVIDNVKSKYSELSEDKYCVYFDEFFKEFRQFHLESKGFGSCMLNYLTKEQLTNGNILSPFKSDGQTLPIPQYIIRKVFYSKLTLSDGSVVYRLNRDGMMRNLTTLSSKIIQSTNKLIELRQYPDDIDLLNELQSESVSSFFDNMDITFKNLGLPLYSLYVYNFVYRNRVVDEDNTEFYRINYAKFVFNYSTDKKINGDSEFFSNEICNYQGVFRIFEKFLAKLSAFKRYDSYHRQLKSIEIYNTKQYHVALSKGSKPVLKPLPDKKDFFTYLNN